MGWVGFRGEVGFRVATVGVLTLLFLERFISEKSFISVRFEQNIGRVEVLYRACITSSRFLYKGWVGF